MRHILLLFVFACLIQAEDPSFSDLSGESPQEKVEPVQTIEPKRETPPKPSGPTYAQKLTLATKTARTYQGRACGGSDFNRGDCFACTTATIEKALGKGTLFLNDPLIAKLNAAPHYAKNFALHWTSAHEDALKLKRAYFNPASYAQGEALALKAPLGSVIIWDKCGNSPAGHSAIVTKPGYACSSFCFPVKSTCTSEVKGHQRIIAVFEPIN